MAAFDVDPAGFGAVAGRLEELGIIAGAQPLYATFRLLPPLVLGEEEIAVFVEALEGALGRAVNPLALRPVPP